MDFHQAVQCRAAHTQQPRRDRQGAIAAGQGDLDDLAFGAQPSSADVEVRQDGVGRREL